MTWFNRLQETIEFTSPSGRSFTAAWAGNDRTLDKSVGNFSYPKVDGSVVQDLGSRGDKYPLTFHFEGPDHDLTSRQFFLACKERGAWIVQHPVEGVLRLQPLTITQAIQPVESGHITVFTSDWVEALESGPLPYAPLHVNADPTLSAVQAAHVANVDLNKPVEYRTVFQRVADLVHDTLAPLSQQLAEVNAQNGSELRGIMEALGSATTDVMSLAGQMQALVTTPALSNQDLTSRLSYYSGLIGQLFPSGGSRNELAVTEVAATSCLVAAVESVNDSVLTNREQAYTAIAALQNMLAAVTAGLDAGQAAYVDAPLAQRYFSQSQSYAATAVMVSSAVNLLLRRSFDLAAAKRFTLERDRAPIEIAITEGVDLDTFIQSNQLKGYDILLLPAGRQVVVYL